jgi:hypothetical protein
MRQNPHARVSYWGMRHNKTKWWYELPACRVVWFFCHDKGALLRFAFLAACPAPCICLTVIAHVTNYVTVQTIIMVDFRPSCLPSPGSTFSSTVLPRMSCHLILLHKKSYFCWQFHSPKKLDRLTKVCLNETYSKVRVGEFCLINFLFHVLSSTVRTLGSHVRILLGAWMCVHIFLCRGLASGWSPVQGVLPNVQIDS